MDCFYFSDFDGYVREVIVRGMAMNLSVCMIVKNEEENIRHCLNCLKPYSFELIVVDTGSTDSTRDIVCQYTENVYEFKWCDDFSAARNFAISKASNEYVMVVDSDEYLESIDLEEVYRMIKENPYMVGRVRIKSSFSDKKQEGENVEWISRIFSKEHYRYEGRVHEQVMALERKDYEVYQLPVVFLHSGYNLTEEKRKEKAQRNIRLLKQELEYLESSKIFLAKEEKIPYVLFQLGKSYYLQGDYLQACEYFSKGLSYELNPNLQYVIDMVETYGYALLNSGQADTALFFENIYEEFGDSADFQFLMGLIYMNNTFFKEAIREFEKATSHTLSRCKGVNSYLAHYNIGVIYECLGKQDMARIYYRKCGDYELAKKRLKEME